MVDLYTELTKTHWIGGEFKYKYIINVSHHDMCFDPAMLCCLLGVKMTIVQKIIWIAPKSWLAYSFKNHFRTVQQWYISWYIKEAHMKRVSVLMTTLFLWEEQRWQFVIFWQIWELKAGVGGGWQGQYWWPTSILFNILKNRCLKLFRKLNEKKYHLGFWLLRIKSVQ